MASLALELALCAWGGKGLQEEEEEEMLGWMLGSFETAELLLELSAGCRAGVSLLPGHWQSWLLPTALPASLGLTRPCEGGQTVPDLG